MNDFLLPKTVRFGAGAAGSLAAELQKFNCSRIGLVSDRGLEKAGVVRQVLDLLGEYKKQTFCFTKINGEPTFRLLLDAVGELQREKCDLIIGLGGGSSMDVAKLSAALLDKSDPEPYLNGITALENRSVPVIAIPTTAGTGSEVTTITIFEDEELQLKRGIVSSVLLPDLAIVDPLLTLSCPAKVTAASGVDAFTHAIESYIAVRSTPMTRIFSEKAMKLFPKYIARSVHHGKDVDARTGMAWVSLFAGVALNNAGVGAVHALAYPLGGVCHIEHGVANALLMPYVFEVIGNACPEEMADAAYFLKLGDYRDRPHEALRPLVRYMYELNRILNLPVALKELGVDENLLPKFADQASTIHRLLTNTPYALNRDRILDIYRKAYHGKEPM